MTAEIENTCLVCNKWQKPGKSSKSVSIYYQFIRFVLLLSQIITVITTGTSCCSTRTNWVIVKMSPAPYAGKTTRKMGATTS